MSFLYLILETNLDSGRRQNEKRKMTKFAPVPLWNLASRDVRACRPLLPPMIRYACVAPVGGSPVSERIVQFSRIQWTAWRRKTKTYEQNPKIARKHMNLTAQRTQV